MVVVRTTGASSGSSYTAGGSYGVTDTRIVRTWVAAASRHAICDVRYEGGGKQERDDDAENGRYGENG